VELIDNRGDESDLEDRLDHSLPGTIRGDLSKRKTRLEARTKAVRYSPTGRMWAAASTEGLLVYSIDETFAFDPFDLDLDLTPQSVVAVLGNHEYLKALVMAFRLNEKPLIERVYEAVPPGDVRLVARQLPIVYVPAMLRFVGDHVQRTPHVEFDLLWIQASLSAHGRFLRDRSVEFASVFRAIQGGLTDFHKSIARTCEDNTSTLRYLVDQSIMKEKATPKSGADVDMVEVA